MLDEEQRRRIEENRRKALEKLSQKAGGMLPSATKVDAPQSNTMGSGSTNPVQPPPVISTAPFVPFVPAQPDPAPPKPSSIVASNPPLVATAPAWNTTQRTSPAKAPPKPPEKVSLQLESAETFSCAHVAHLYEAVKSIPGFKMVPGKTAGGTGGTWSIPLKHYNAFLEKIPAKERPEAKQLIPASVLKVFESPYEIARRKATDAFDLSGLEAPLRAALFPFQREGIQMALARSGRVILADDMGLGKSIQALGIASYYRTEWPLLIIAPASMVASWHEQVLRWLPSVQPASISVMYDGRGQLDGLVNIGSFDLLARNAALVSSRNFRVVVVDESHALKNKDSKRAKALIPLVMKASRAVLLSGTPALSRPIELFSQIMAVSPKLFPKYFEFGIRYCAGYQGFFGWDMKGCSNSQELNLILQNTIMIRRTKDEVLAQLPPKIRQQIFLKIAPKDMGLFAGLKGGKGVLGELSMLEELPRHGQLMDLWRKTAEAKLPAMKEYIEDLLEAGHKMLLFAHHQSVLDAFEAAFMEKHHRHIRIDGKTPPSTRQDLCNSFQQDATIRIALLSITAASTGLTLTAATTVVFAELFWNPGVMVQAEDRAHRIGQCDSVNVHYLLARGTTDDNVWPLILKKLNTLESVGLGKNDFKGMANREHDKAQPHIDLMLKAKRLKREGQAGSTTNDGSPIDHGIVVIDDDDDE